MTALSINVNKIALLRNSRGSNNPNLIDFAKQALDLGVQGITVHPRPDQRHVCYSDLAPLKELVDQYPNCEFNIEGYPSNDFIEQVIAVKPHQVTFVPDPPEALTSSFGWDVIEHLLLLTQVISKLHDHEIRTSLFLDTHFFDFNALIATRTDRVEFYTGPYALNFGSNPAQAVAPYVNLAQQLKRYNIGINAGHDLTLDNCAYFLSHVENVLEVSIGHQVVCDALDRGWKPAIQAYLDCVQSV